MTTPLPTSVTESTEKNIQLLVATGLYPPDIGGPATYVRMLEEQLPQHGFNVHVVAFTSVRYLPKVVRHIVFTWKLFCASFGKDIVYALDPVSVGVPSWIVSILSRKIFVLRVAGDYAWEQGQLRSGVKDVLEVFYKKRFSYGFLVSIFSYIESFITRRAKLAIIPSRYLSRIVNEWGADPRRVHTIYSALDPLVVPDTKVSLRAKLHYSGQILVSAGRLVPNKGFAKLLEVFSEIAVLKNYVTLIIVGDGPDERELKQLVKKLQLESRVQFTGRLSKTDLGEVIKASDMFILNTEHEGFSHQLLEVMDLGIPIITTRVGGNSELIEHERNGLLVPFNDHDALKKEITRLLEDIAYAETLATRAKEDVEKFKSGDLVGELADLLRHKATAHS